MRVGRIVELHRHDKSCPTPCFEKPQVQELILVRDADAKLPRWEQDLCEARGHAGACLRKLQDAVGAARTAGEDPEALKRLEQVARNLFAMLHDDEN